MKRHFPVTLHEAACALPRAGRLVRPARNVDQTIRQLFRRLRHGTTRDDRTSPHCLARNIARPPGRLLLEPHSHSTAFQSPGFPRQAPGTTPAAAELPALAMFFELRVTSLSGVTRRNRHRVRTCPQAHTVCTIINGDFGGPNVEASPYPAMEVIRGLAPSPAILTGKPFRAFHG